MLVKNEDKEHMPIFYVSKVMLDAETRYTHGEADLCSHRVYSDVEIVL